MNRQDAARLIARIAEIRLFAHAYSWHLNLRFGDATLPIFCGSPIGAPSLKWSTNWDGMIPFFERTRRQLQSERSRKTLF
jgi:hypothetical protein